MLNQNSYLDLISKNLCKQVEFCSAVECFLFVPLLGWNFENESGNGRDTVYLYFVNWNGIVLATFQARPVPKKNSFNPQLRWTFFLKHFQLDQTNPHSFRLQFKSFCLPHVLVWTLNNRTLFYRESRSVTSVSPNQHRKHFPAVQSEILLLNLFTVLSGLNIFSSKPTSILH